MDVGSARATVESVATALAVVQAVAPDTVVGIGGGTVMDLAKAITVLRPGEPSDVANAVRSNEVSPQRTCHLVLVPTTAGSGSELTQFATIWDNESKHSLDAPSVRADVALIDPDLVASAPVPVAAAAGADAVAQATESCWAVAGTPASGIIARAAFEALVPALAAGCERGSFADPSLRERLSWGASLAGAAINVSRTTAAHAFSYALTSQLGIPHGAAVALHLPWLIQHNREVSQADCQFPGGPEALRNIIDDLDTWCFNAIDIDIAALLRRLLHTGGFANDLSALRLDRAAWTAEWCHALESPRMRNNPRLVTVVDVADLMRSKGS